jgi:hypothetical protein
MVREKQIEEEVISEILVADDSESGVEASDLKTILRKKKKKSSKPQQKSP